MGKWQPSAESLRRKRARDVVKDKMGKKRLCFSVWRIFMWRESLAWTSCGRTGMMGLFDVIVYVNGALSVLFIAQLFIRQFKSYRHQQNQSAWPTPVKILYFRYPAPTLERIFDKVDKWPQITLWGSEIFNLDRRFRKRGTFVKKMATSSLRQWAASQEKAITEWSRVTRGQNSVSKRVTTILLCELYLMPFTQDHMNVTRWLAIIEQISCVCVKVEKGHTKAEV